MMEERLRDLSEGTSANFRGHAREVVIKSLVEMASGIKGIGMGFCSSLFLEILIFTLIA